MVKNLVPDLSQIYQNNLYRNKFRIAHSYSFIVQSHEIEKQIE